MLTLADAPQWAEVQASQKAKPKRHRRLNRDQERNPFRAARVIPQGSQRPTSPFQWYRAVEAHAHVETMHPVGRKNLLAICRVLMNWTHRGSMTTAPGWERLREAPQSVGLGQWSPRSASPGKLGRSTVAAHLVLLRELGLLATLAGGRLAEHTPVSSGQAINEVAVYVICVPSDLAEMIDAPAPERGPVAAADVCAVEVLADVDGEAVDSGVQGGDRTWTPPCQGLKEEPTHAREAVQVRAHLDAAAPRNHRGTGACGHGANPAGAHRPAPRWSPVATVAGTTRGEAREARIRAARVLQDRVPVLRELTSEHVAALCREWFLAGWCVDDLAHAIAWLPENGQRQPHSGSLGVVRPGDWLLGRLRPWRGADGSPGRSRRQAVIDRGDELAAQRKADAEKRKREAERVAAAGGWSAVAEATHRNAARARAVATELARTERLAREHAAAATTTEDQGADATTDLPTKRVSFQQLRAEADARRLAELARHGV